MLLTIKLTNAEKKNVSLQVEPKTTIASLKKQLADAYGGKWEYYQLAHEDKELNDEAATLEGCSISGDHNEIVVCGKHFSNSAVNKLGACNCTDPYQSVNHLFSPPADSFFIITIRGPFPLFESNTLKVTQATTIARIKDEVARLHDYTTPNEFDLLLNGLSLVNGTVGKHKITSGDLLAVAERIGMS